MAVFAIGELSQRTGVHVETIRYYERIKLIPTPSRSAAGRRFYADGDAQRLRFIRRARELGFSIEDVRALLELADGGGCADVHALTVRHRDAVRAKIADLRRLDGALTAVAAECGGGPSAACPIIGALEGADG